MKHEWKKGDKVVLEVKDVERYELCLGCGHVWHNHDGQVWIKADGAIPAPPDHSEYVGKMVSGVPEGTLAVITDNQGGSLDVAVKKDGIWVYVTQQGNPNENLGTPDPEGEVHHIIKLGEPKLTMRYDGFNAFRIQAWALKHEMAEAAFAREWEEIRPDPGDTIHLEPEHPRITVLAREQ